MISKPAFFTQMEEQENSGSRSPTFGACNHRRPILMKFWETPGSIGLFHQWPVAPRKPYFKKRDTPTERQNGRV